MADDAYQIRKGEKEKRRCFVVKNVSHKHATLVNGSVN